MIARFKRDVRALAEVFRFVETFFAAEAVDPGERFAVDFALEEIFTNFVKYNRDSAGDIEVRLSLRDGELVMELVDYDSDSFDINRDTSEIDIAQPLQDRTPGGLGVHLVKSLMDRVEYRHEERTSTVTLYKRLGENHA